jgi:hypothetical protein
MAVIGDVHFRSISPPPNQIHTKTEADILNQCLNYESSHKNMYSYTFLISVIKMA